MVSLSRLRRAATALLVMGTLLALIMPAAADARPASAACLGTASQKVDVAFAGSTGRAAAAEKACAKKPNILVVMTDDQALADVKYMPNVRKLLAQKGTQFTNAIDSFPLCCPARATFITGQYAHNHGVVGNFWPYGWYGMKDRGNILPAWLQKSGYTTALIGKWLNGYGSLDEHGEIPKGFDTWRGLLDVSAYDYYNYVMNQDGKLRTWGDADFARNLVKMAYLQVKPGFPRPGLTDVLGLANTLFKPGYWGTEEEKNYSPDVTGTVTEGLIKDQAKAKKPFFVWWAPSASHREDVATTVLGRPGRDPRPPKRYEELVKKYQLPKPPSFNEADMSGKAKKLGQTLPLLTQAKQDQLQLDYEGRIGSLLAVDDHVAKMVKLLKKTNQMKNTVIVFVSDNGWLQGEHRVPGDKFLPYEESLKVPFILAGPGVPVDRTVGVQVSNVDFAATLLQIAGAKAGRTQDGIPLIPVARNEKKTAPRALGIEAPSPLFLNDTLPQQWDQPYTGVRTADWKFVEWKTGETELYDLKKDPYEINNVVGDPANAAIKARLQGRMKKLTSCKGKSCTMKP